MAAGSQRYGRAVPAVADGRAVKLRLDRVDTASRVARAHLRTELAELDPETLETVLLVTTELVTNAVLHATGDVDLTATVGPRQVSVAVFDCEPLPPLVRDHDLQRPNGRGMALVSMFSREWGTRYHDGGKTVWSLIDRP